MAYRGCMSDDDDFGKAFCERSSENCKKCSNRACNANLLELATNFSCIKCNPSEHSDCNAIDESTTAIECAPIASGYKNECYTYRDDNVSRRGCLYEAPDDIFNECINVFSDKCLICNQIDCNRDSIIIDDSLKIKHSSDGSKPEFNSCKGESCTKTNSRARHCYKCDSTNDSNCVDKLNNDMISVCPFTEVDMECFHLIRGIQILNFILIEFCFVLHLFQFDFHKYKITFQIQQLFVDVSLI